MPVLFGIPMLNCLIMTTNQIILYTFLSAVAIVIVSGYLTKSFRSKREKNRTSVPRKIRKIDIELKGDFFELDKIAIILDDLERYQIPTKTIIELNVIIEEVFTNIINLRKEGQHDNRILITLMVETDQIIIIIKDHNDEFNPTTLSEIDLNAPLEEISFQWLGFHMVRRLTDHLSYQRIEGQNVLTLKKNYSRT
jgi:serine/threonine-protein kinase RsbW